VAAGVVGPAAFVVAWLVAGALTEGYSATDEAISRLAATGAPRRALMTAGFVCFGVAMVFYAGSLRRRFGDWVGIAAATSGGATLGVALFPLDTSTALDGAHNVLAALGYVALAATPVLAARPLAAGGRRRTAVASTVTGLLAGACLLATVAGPAHGLFQRAGLTIVDAWLMATAVWTARTRDVPAQPIRASGRTGR